MRRAVGLKGKSELRRSRPKEKEIIYGPVRSRRLGNSLGINVNLRKGKTCTIDCVYCQYGRTSNLISSSETLTDWLREDKILEEVETWLRRLSLEDGELNSITFSGYGESTLYPRLKEAVLGVKKLRDEYYPGVRVDILTNGKSRNFCCDKQTCHRNTLLRRHCGRSCESPRCHWKSDSSNPHLQID
jgi:wyosine [tRNA(Phe)-imidazoG37] synthetase (radical SAM superfamily)